MRYKIVADSTSNVFTTDNIDYDYVPLTITIDGEEFLDTKDLDLSLFIERLRGAKETSTSCPNIYDWQERFSDADGIFAITVTGSLSGCYTSCENAKRLFAETHDSKIHIINSLSTGPEMRLIIEKLEELISRELPFDEIVEEIEAYRKNTHLIFCLESLANLARNGRISHTKAQLAGLFGIRVVGRASPEGVLDPFAKPRGAKKALKAMFDEMLSKGFNGGKAHICHVFNIKDATELKEMIIEKFPETEITISPCAALCSYYAEIGGLLVGYES